MKSRNGLAHVVTDICTTYADLHDVKDTDFTFTYSFSVLMFDQAGRWGTTNDFTIFSILVFSTALWDLANSGLSFP